MNGKKALVALAIIAAPAVLGISSAAGSSCREDPSQCGGFVCSLAAWTGSIRSITPISSATPQSLDHMVLSGRGMALGR
jgi:hypothetical protein